MSNKKQTAIEWVRDRVQSRMGFSEIIDLLEQAKEMEKEQMIDFGFDTYCFISGIMNVPFEQLSENILNAENNYKENYEH